jgi:hypothetical protein
MNIVLTKVNKINLPESVLVLITGLKCNHFSAVESVRYPKQLLNIFLLEDEDLDDH